MALPIITRHGKMDRGFFLILFLLCLTSSDIKAQIQHHTLPQNLQKFSWILGNWKLEERNSYERWTYNSDTTRLYGISYSIKELGDTAITERLYIIKEGTDWYYLADVPDNAKMIRFKIVQKSPQGFQSENKSHDYPQYISYKMESTDRIRTEIGNTHRKQVFILEKQPDYK